MPRRRPRLVIAQFEEQRQRERAYTLAHLDELHVTRLTAQFSAAELAALSQCIAGYVASGVCRDMLWHHSQEGTRG